MRVVYLDTLLLLNFFVDYLLLLLTARMAGRYPRRRNLAAGAAVGAAFAAVLYFPPMPRVVALLLRIAACGGTVLAAFPREPKRYWPRLCGLFALLTFVLAGVALGLIFLGGQGLTLQNGVVYAELSWPVLLVSFLAIYGLSGLVLGKGRAGVSRRYHEVQALLGEKKTRFRALEDSGNLLRDPINGKKIIVAQPSAIGELFDSTFAAWFEEGARNGPEDLLPQLRQRWGVAFWLAPAHTAAQDCMILVFRPEILWVDGEKSEEYLLGLTAQRLEIGGDCLGLIGV